MQDLKIQLEALCQLRSFLVKLRDDLGSAHHFYNQRVESLCETGLSKQVAQGFSKRLEQDVAVMNRLIHNMEEKDIPYLTERIRRIENAIQATY